MMNRNSLRLFFILCCLGIVTVTASSCSGDDPAADPELIVSTEALSFSNEGEAKFFHIKSNLDWEVTSSESWLTVSPGSGSAGTIKIDVVAEANPLTAERTATLTAKTGSLIETITATQGASSILVVEQDEFDVAVEGGELIVPI